jgi:RHS repeat-associated protein
VLVSDATGRTTTTYDAAGRVSGAAAPNNQRITCTYDAAGRRTRLTDPDGGRFSYAYDPANRVTNLVNPQGERTTWAYDAAGRSTVQRLGNGTRASYSYDAANRLTRVVHLTSANVTLTSFDYRLDAVGNRQRVAEASGDRTTWTFDPAYRLTREWRTGAVAFTLTHTYDPAGNRLAKIDGGARTTFIYDAANQLLTRTDSTGRTTFTYDANGNQLVQQAPAGRTTQVWDGDNQLAQVLLPSGVRNTYSYDGIGRRVQRQDSTGSAQLVWDGEDVLREASTGVLLSQYTLRPGRYGMVVAQRRSGASQFYHADALGSTSRLTDATQTGTDQYWYEAYGALRTSAGASVNPFRFVGGAGYYFDPDAATYLLRARQYAPSQARFLSRDPLAFVAPARDRRRGRADRLAGGWPNLYGYAGGNPVLATDPGGLLAPLVAAPLLGPALVVVTTTVVVPTAVAVTAVAATAVVTFVAVCGALDIHNCGDDYARCLSFAPTQAGQCASKACLPRKFQPNEAVSQAKCQAMYLTQFQKECSDLYAACILTCSWPREPAYSCVPNPCMTLCCSTDETTCHSELGCLPVGRVCVPTTQCPRTQCGCENISEPGEPTKCICNERA